MDEECRKILASLLPFEAFESPDTLDRHLSSIMQTERLLAGLAEAYCLFPENFRQMLDRRFFFTARI